jgi:Terminase large subunit, T4likevirus-type, N-terminal
LPELLDQLLDKLKALPVDTQAELSAIADDALKGTRWVPLPGPQTQALNSPADIVLYGGSAGGGKTDLLLGAAFTHHTRSLIMRKEYTDLSSLTERAIEMNGTRRGFNGSIPPKLRTADRRLITFGAANREGKEQSFQGQPHDLLGFDEVPQFSEKQVRYLITWVRSTREGQRCRCIMAGNPPVDAQGQWLIQFFAPWLDPTYPEPAKPGELRYFITDDDDNDIEVASLDPITMPNGKIVRPLSRTFIPARLSDNPHLMRTDYAAKLDALPEPYRSAYRDGNFMLARKDQAFQVIPTAWVLAAQQRWSNSPPIDVPMCSIGCDIAMGGKDEFVLAPRYDGWFDKFTVIPGKEVTSGRVAAGHVVMLRRGDAEIIIDLGGGYGLSCFEHLRDNNIPVVGFKGAEASTGRTADKQYGFYNLRSEVIWRMREALDPSQDGGSPIALPPDPLLVADLTTPTFELVPGRGIKIMNKEDVVEKLGRSPDRGDAVCMGWKVGGKMASHYDNWKERARSGTNKAAKVIRAHDRQRQFLRR